MDNPPEITPYLYNVAKLYLWHFFYFFGNDAVSGNWKRSWLENPFTEKVLPYRIVDEEENNWWVQRCGKNFSSDIIYG